MSEVDGAPNVKCPGCDGKYVPAGKSGVFECVECGDELEQTDALAVLAEHREPIEEIAESAATDAHVARVILAALDGEAAPAEDINQLVDVGVER